MSMGKRKRYRQPAVWVTTTDLPTAASHPFYRRLNQLLREHGFDDFVETQCAGCYAETIGRPGLRPGIYFRLLLIGYFEGLNTERAIARRAEEDVGIDATTLEANAAVRTIVGATRARAITTSSDLVVSTGEVF